MTLLATVFILSTGLPSSGYANPLYASFVMDADTGMILHQRYANKKLHPASMTKVMTLLMVFDALDQGKITLNDPITISKRAAGMAPSKIGLAPGATIKVKDAIMVLVTKSANDIATAVAEHLGGTESNFASMMTRRAHEIGMTNSTFINASGLHDKNQLSTARDMARMAHYVIKTYPAYYKFFNEKSYTYRGVTYNNHNHLMKSYPGMDGMKTGFINPSGFNLVASAVRNNRRVIGVVFGGRSTASRNAHMAKLLDGAFAKITDVRSASLNSADQEQMNLETVRLSAVTVTPPPVVPLPQAKPIAITEQTAASVEPASGSVLPAAPARVALVEETPLPAAATSIQDNSSVLPTSYAIPHEEVRSWAIQVGAFRSKDQSAKAIRTALTQLPKYYTKAQPIIVPLQTSSQEIYRARLSGYSSQDAYAACAYIKECIAIAP